MSSCFVNVTNNSGRAIDGMIMWHFSAPPEYVGLSAQTAFFQVGPIPDGVTVHAATETMEGSPVDYWVAQIVYSGDGQVYVMSDTLCDAYKEFEVSDGSTVAFTLAAYSEGTVNQNDGTITYGGEVADSFRVLNPTAQEIAGDAADILTHFLGHLVGA
jgi:hypothetical protein